MALRDSVSDTSEHWLSEPERQWHLLHGMIVELIQPSLP